VLALKNASTCVLRGVSNILTLQVLLDPARRHRLGQDHDTTLDEPRQHDLGGRQVERLRDLLHLGDFERISNELATPERAVRLEKQAALLGEREQLRLRIPEAELDLVDGRLDLEIVRG
jgi:hypothetical protein